MIPSLNGSGKKKKEKKVIFKESCSGAFVVHEEIVHRERSEKEGWRALYPNAMAARGLNWER